MLKLIRRPVTDFLGPEHRKGLQNRAASARRLATDPALTVRDKSTRIGYQWDAFRKGETSRGTFDGLWCELRAMAFDKCAFCEIPAPDTVEHLAEKGAHPAQAFDWPNLLAACATCNRQRENSGLTAAPLDPSAIEPLDYFGWDEYGNIAPALVHAAQVQAHETMYGLRRFAGERRRLVQTVRVLIATIAVEAPLRTEILDALRETLTGTTAWLGPVREHLLRPPSDDDALLLDEALRRRPEIRTWVAPWLRPPPWVHARWR